MENIIKATLIGLFAGTIGTGFGGFLAFFIKKGNNKLLSMLLEFSAGIMTAVVCFDLLPESFLIGSLKTGLIGIILGIVSIIVSESILNKTNKLRKRIGKNSLAMSGILLFIGISLHNFPEGIAIGSVFNTSYTVAMGIIMAIALHDIPEGLAMATPLIAGGISKRKTFVLAIISGVPTGLGALIGSVLGRVSNIIISLCLGFAAGAMLYIVSHEIIPESKGIYNNKSTAYGYITGILAGMIISFSHR